MINLPEQTITLNQYLDDDNMEIHITGRASLGTRRLLISIPVIEGDRQVDVVTKTFEGADFNAAYDAYANDKALVALVVEPTLVAQMPDNNLNQEVTDVSSGN